MSETTTALLAIGISVLSVLVTVFNLLLMRATNRRLEHIRRGHVFGIDFH